WAERYLAVPRGEAIGRVAWDVIASPVGPALRAVFDRVLAGEEILVVPSVFAQGRWHEIVAHLVGDEVVVFGRDITERLQAEALRKQIEERFRVPVDGVKDCAMVLLDPKGQVATGNAGSERLIGYRPDKILGKALPIFYLPGAAPRARRNLEAAVAHGR